MTYDEQTGNGTKRQQMQRDNQARNGFGTTRPSRRTVDGYNSPCEECGVVDWTRDDSRGEISCNSCGVVVEENCIDPGAEWTNHDAINDRSRVGAPTTYTLADKGLNTSISLNDLSTGGASRHGIKGQARRDWRRRRTIDERSKSRAKGLRSLVKANQVIRDKSGLPPRMVEEVCHLYRKLSESGYVTGRSINGVAAACTYLVARSNGVSRQIQEIGDRFQVDEKELGRMIRRIGREHKLGKSTTPADYFNKFVSDLELPPNTMIAVTRLWEIIEPYEEDVWQGKKPSGVAAAIIYKAAKEGGHSRTQADICKVSKVSEVTLRGLLKLIDGLLKSIGEPSEN